MKKLRKYVDEKHSKKIRFFGCGEYGEKNDRPHYHVCIFGFEFSDQIHHSTSDDGHRLYTSATLDKIWGYGHALIGSVTFESVAYVARYITKKASEPNSKNERIRAKQNEIYLEKYLDKETGIIKNPEFVTMSRRPGIGKNYFEKYIDEMYPQDEIVVRGVKQLPPKYYDKLLEKRYTTLGALLSKYRNTINPLTSTLYMYNKSLHVKTLFRRKALINESENTYERLAVKEHLKLIQTKQLRRKLK